MPQFLIVKYLFANKNKNFMNFGKPNFSFELTIVSTIGCNSAISLLDPLSMAGCVGHSPCNTRLRKNVRKDGRIRYNGYV